MHKNGPVNKICSSGPVCKGLYFARKLRMALSMLPCMVSAMPAGQRPVVVLHPAPDPVQHLPHKAVFVKPRDKSLVLLRQGGADHYGAIEIPLEASQILFTDRVAPFWNFCFEEVGNHQLWGIHLPQQYFQALHLPDIEGMRLRPQQTCLCSILDLGPIGQFDPNYANPLWLICAKRVMSRVVP